MRITAVVLLAPALILVSYLLILGALTGLGYRPFGSPHPLTIIVLVIGQAIAVTVLTASLAAVSCFEKSSLGTYAAVGALVGALSLTFMGDLPGYGQAFWILPLQHGLVGLGTGFAILRAGT